MKLQTGAIAVLGTLVAASAFAADLKPPFELESTKVLPRKVGNPRMKLLFMPISDRFSSEGVNEPLGVKLNKRVSWNDIVKAQKTDADKALIQGVLNDPAANIQDRSLSASPGETTGQVNTFANVMVPVLAFGVTEKLTLAAAVPIMKINVDAATGFKKSADGQAWVDQACSNNPDKCNEAALKLNDAINQKLANNGYETIPSEQTIDSVGDMKVVGKYLLEQNDSYAVTLKSEVTLPTGTPLNVDKALDVPTGDGQTDVGLGVIVDTKVTDRWNWNTYAAYTAQLPDTQERRLPAGFGDSISDVKEVLKRDLGDLVAMGTSVSYYSPRLGTTVGAGYAFQYLDRTRYQNGALGTDETYRLLEGEFPYQLLHSATVTAGFSTVDFFRQKQFVYPFQANLSYSFPLLGRNVTNNEVVSAELVLFF